MTEFILLFVVLAVLIRPLGAYMADVYMGNPLWSRRALGWLEKGIYRIAGIDPSKDMSWKRYAGSLLAFSFAGFIVLYTLLLCQAYLPLNPQNLPNVAPDLAFNIAVSFLTNTNWQSYGGESTLSYFSQMAGLTVQNFLSAAAGMAAAAALFRSFTRKKNGHIGNFWSDLTRGAVYILLPLSLIFALLLASQGVIQNFKPPVEVQTLQGETQILPMGPVASQVSIKQLGSNGGGFFSANSAHPFENPTPLSNFLELLAVLLIPAAFVYTFGRMIGDVRQGWAIFAAMAIIFIPLMVFAVGQEYQNNPSLRDLPIEMSSGNMEGKEVRFGADMAALWAVATTATSNGSVNSSLDSFMPLGGMVPMLMMQLGEVVFGGVGVGMTSMLIFVIITVFIAGLMVGRTPEYLGKKLGPFEIKMASLVIILPVCMALAATAIAVSVNAGRGGIYNPGAQGFSEVLYAFLSAANNNGSAFAGLSSNSVFYNTLIGIVIFFGRFMVIIPALAIAGAVSAKNNTPVNNGTLPTHTPLFVTMLIGIILLLGVLSYAPVLALGPVAEHLHLTGE